MAGRLAVSFATSAVLSTFEAAIGRVLGNLTISTDRNSVVLGGR